MSKKGGYWILDLNPYAVNGLVTLPPGSDKLRLTTLKVSKLEDLISKPLLLECYNDNIEGIIPAHFPIISTLYENDVLKGLKVFPYLDPEESSGYKFEIRKDELGFYITNANEY